MNIIITGASSGIGLALKNHYENLGHVVFDISLDGQFPCDVSDEQAMKAVFEKLPCDKIDMVIANAGFGVSGAIELVDSKKIDNIFEVNVIGAANTIRCALPKMQEGGKIIFVASVLGLFPTPFRGYYCATKSALISISDTLRMELAQSKIQVTAICPSEIKTNFSKNRVKVMETNERYGSRVGASMQHIDDKENRRMPVEKATKIITSWIDRKRLKPLYIMTFKFKVLYFFKNILPKSWYLKICNRMFNKKES